CEFDVSGVVIRQRLLSRPGPEDTPARCHLRAKDKPQPSSSILNPPYHRPVRPHQREHCLEFSTNHLHSGLAGCCFPFAFAPDARRFFPAPDETADSMPLPAGAQSPAQGSDVGVMGCSQPKPVPVVVPSFAPSPRRLPPIDPQTVRLAISPGAPV